MAAGAWGEGHPDEEAFIEIFGEPIGRHDDKSGLDGLRLIDDREGRRIEFATV